MFSKAVFRLSAVTSFSEKVILPRYPTCASCLLRNERLILQGLSTSAAHVRTYSTKLSESTQLRSETEKYSKYDPTAFTETDEQFMHVSSFSQFSSTVEQDDEEEGADSTATIGATTNVSTSSGEEDNDGYAIKTEIDRIWIERISQSAKSSAKMKSPSQFIRYPLEDFLDMYKKKYPDKTPDEWTKIDNLVDEVFRRAYEDTAPPEISVEEFEMFLGFWTENEASKRNTQNKLPCTANERNVLPPRNDAHRYLKFLFKNYWKRKSEERHQAEKREIHQQRIKPENSTWLTAMTKSYRRISKNFQKDKLASATRVGQPVVVDMSYDHLMNDHAIKDMARQILIMINFFSKIPEPFHLYVTNMEECSPVYKYLDKLLCGVDHIGTTVTALSYMQVFPPKQLVYLTPDSPYDLEDYNPDDIFIIGGLVDKVIRKEASFTNARRDRIRTARFPLKQNARIRADGPLNFIEVVHILNRFSFHGDIHRALLEGVSKRRLLRPEVVDELLQNQLKKARRLVGDPNFVERSQKQALKRIEVFERMEALDLNNLRQKAYEPHEVAAW